MDYCNGGPLIIYCSLIEMTGDIQMASSDTEDVNRFANIIEDLPVKTRLTLSTLSLLNDVSTQLLRFLISNAHTPNVIAVISNKENYISTGESEMFHTLVRIFKNIRDVYESRTPLLNVNNVAPGLWLLNMPPPTILKGHEAYIISTIRKANLVTFILTVINCLPYGFDFLQKVYLDVFCPNTILTDQTNGDQVSKFLKPQAIIYLDLKTHAYISSIRDHLGANEQIPDAEKRILLDTIFPDNIAMRLVNRKIVAPNEKKLLTPSEKEFVGRCERRKETLIKFTKYTDLLNSYDWTFFVKELLEYCGKNMNLIVWGKKGRSKTALLEFNPSDFDPQILFATGSHLTTDLAVNSHDPSPIGNTFDTGNKEKLIDANELRPLTDAESESINNEIQSALQNESGQGMQKNFMDDAHMSGGENVHSQLVDSNNSILSDVISKSPSVKVVKAKRTWSKEEEKTLITGLIDLGPAWAKILDLYGPGGKINENLKNRTQVQLKDKARNWKLHYLKTGKPLPEYLNRVTGNLDKIAKTKRRGSKEGSIPPN